jgi:group I intron endonuclease
MLFIYKITNLINGKIYIGQTINPSRRWSQHKSNAKLQKGKQIITAAIRKYGPDSFSFQIIATCLSQDQANCSEELIIQQENSRHPNIGYNVDKGGMLQSQDPIIAAKISHSLKKYYQSHDNWNKGGTLSPEWKEKISQSHVGKTGTNTGKTLPNNWKLKISQSQAGQPKLSKRKFPPQIEQEICQLYINNNSAYSLAKQFQCHRTVITDILIRHHITLRVASNNKRKKLFSAEQELEICQEYQQKIYSRTDLAIKYKCSKTTIRDILIRHSVQL